MQLINIRTLMKKLCTLLAFLTFITFNLRAQSISTFKSLGHPDEVITGMSGSTSFYFKLDPQVELRGSKMVLFFQPSQALYKDKSFINILIGGRQVFSSRLSKDSIQRIALNLTPEYLSPDKKYLIVQVRTLLTLDDNKCKDLDNPAMWMRILGNSYLSLIKTNKNFFNNVNIANSFETKSVIVYPKNPTLIDLKAAAWAYAKLKKSQISDIKVYEADKLPDFVHSYVAVGELSRLSANVRQLLRVTPQKSDGLFYLYKSVITVTDTVTRLVNIKGNIVAVKSVAPHVTPSEIMVVTGNGDDGLEKSITALGNANILNSTFGDYLIVNKAQNTSFKTADANRSKLTLRQVGGVTNFMSGIGSLRSVYNFKNSDFSFTPKEIEIHFEGIYSGLNTTGDRGFFNIYLNGMLINSEKLDQSGKLSTSVTINRYQHHKYNTLEAEFRFYPSSGNCENSFTNFFGEIDVDKSSLESRNPFITSDLSFYQYPEAFNSGTTRIVVSKNYAKYAAAAMGEVIFELNNNINANNFPEFVYSDDMNNGGDLRKYNIVALLDRKDAIMGEFPDAPIRFQDRFRLYNNENNKVVYSLSDSTSNGLAQIFYGRGNNAVLVITGTGKNLAGSFLSASRSITEQLSTLASNVCIADVASNKYLFNISKSSENLEYVDAKSALSRFWESYNLYILLAILVLILLSFLYIRSKIQKSQEFPNE
jgi:hypothetical protein